MPLFFLPVISVQDPEQVQPFTVKKTVEVMGEEAGESPKQVQRYLKISELMFFNLAGFIIILTGILCFCFELEPASEMWRMVSVGIGFYILTMAADFITTGIGFLNLIVQKWLVEG